jgi:putative PIN family toxin of toxin-antitoxin system
VRVILDTNVLISAVFFGGIPGHVLDACVDGEHTLAVSPSVYSEYQRIGQELGRRYSQRKVVWESVLAQVAAHALHVDAAPLGSPVSDDVDDDNFFACALAARPCLIVSGDKRLLDVSGWNEIEALTPRKFHDRYLRHKDP